MRVRYCCGFWFLTLYSALVVLIHWKTHPRSMPYVSGNLGGRALVSGADPLSFPVPSPSSFLLPAEAPQLNPLLQDPGSIIHPPMLYLGYVGFVVPFASCRRRAHSGKCRRRMGGGNAPVDLVRLAGPNERHHAWGATGPITSLDGAATGLGIPSKTPHSCLGLLNRAAALHHGSGEQNCSGAGTRSWPSRHSRCLSWEPSSYARACWTSVHAFAVDPTRGTYLLAFLGIVTLGGFGLLIYRADTLRSNARLDGLLSRESTLLFNTSPLLSLPRPFFWERSIHWSSRSWPTSGSRWRLRTSTRPSFQSWSRSCGSWRSSRPLEKIQPDAIAQTHGLPSARPLSAS